MLNFRNIIQVFTPDERHQEQRRADQWSWAAIRRTFQTEAKVGVPVAADGTIDLSLGAPRSPDGMRELGYRGRRPRGTELRLG